MISMWPNPYQDAGANVVERRGFTQGRWDLPRRSSHVAQLLFSLGAAPRFMKTRYILLGLLMVSTAVLATIIGLPYDKSKPPTLALPAAYQFAVSALGSATNQFHCISATVSQEISAPAWYFTFCSTNTPPKQRWIVVEFGGNVFEDNGYR
jgi:hypothetical protein